MTKTELIDKISEQTGLTKRASAQAVNATLDSITDALANGDKVLLAGFGAFEVKERKGRTGRNPITKEPIHIANCNIATFRPSASLKKLVK